MHKKLKAIIAILFTIPVSHYVSAVPISVISEPFDSSCEFRGDYRVMTEDEAIYIFLMHNTPAPDNHQFYQIKDGKEIDLRTGTLHDTSHLTSVAPYACVKKGLILNSDSDIYYSYEGGNDIIDNYIFNRSLIENYLPKLDAINSPSTSSEKLLNKYSSDEILHNIQIVAKIDENTNTVNIKPSLINRRSELIFSRNSNEYADSYLNLTLRGGYIHFDFYGDRVQIPKPLSFNGNKLYFYENTKFGNDLDLKLMRVINKINDDVKYVLIDITVLPNKVIEQVKTEQLSNFTVRINEASFVNGSFIKGRGLLSNVINESNDLHFNVSDYTLKQWLESSIYANQFFQNDDPFIDPEKLSTKSNVLVIKHYASPYLHKGIDIKSVNKRCLNDFVEHLFQFTVSFWQWITHTRESVCELNPSSLSPVASTIISPEAPTEIPSLGNYGNVIVTQSDSNIDDDFDRASNMLIFNDDISTVTNETHLDRYPQDIQAMHDIGDLSTETVNRLLTELFRYNNEAAVGAIAPFRANTGISRLDQFILENPTKAESFLNTAKLIGNHSRKQVSEREPISRRKQKGKKENIGVLASTCSSKGVANTDTPAGESGWQCVERGRKRIRNSNENVDVALPPRTQSGLQFFRRDNSGFCSVPFRNGSDGFCQLSNEVVNQGLSFPPGYSTRDMMDHVWGYARDGAHTGKNMGIIYLPDANYYPSKRRNDRFKYGLNHIFSKVDGGHFNEWSKLGITSSDMLATLLMSAVSSVTANFTQHISRAGRLRRMYTNVVFTYNNRLYIATNINIIIGSNGMIITSFPSGNSTLNNIREL